MQVFILAFSPSAEVKRPARLVFETLRTGFPDALVTVLDNSRHEAAREVFRELAAKTECDYRPLPKLVAHYDALLGVLMNVDDGPIAFVDTDIAFWEPMTIDGDVEHLDVIGRLIPAHTCPITGMKTAARLHTSLLLVPDVKRLKKRIADAYAVARFGSPDQPEWHPFRPVIVATGVGPKGRDNEEGLNIGTSKWCRYDTGSQLISCTEWDSFLPSELERYDHLFCGSNMDALAQAFQDKGARDLILRGQADPDLIKGIWREQDEMFRRLGA